MSTAASITINEAAEILRVTRSRIYQLVNEGVIERCGDRRIALDSVLRRAFRISGNTVMYVPLQWQFDVHEPAPSWWPRCGAKTLNSTRGVASERVPDELAANPDFAARIARYALDSTYL